MLLKHIHLWHHQLFFFPIQLEPVPGLPLFLRTIVLEFQSFFLFVLFVFDHFELIKPTEPDAPDTPVVTFITSLISTAFFSCTSVILKRVVFLFCFFLMINQAFNIINSHHVTSCITGAKEWWLLKTGQLWSLKSLNYLWWVILGIIHKRDQFTTILLENTP